MISTWRGKDFKTKGMFKIHLFYEHFLNDACRLARDFYYHPKPCVGAHF